MGDEIEIRIRTLASGDYELICTDGETNEITAFYPWVEVENDE